MTGVVLNFEALDKVLEELQGLSIDRARLTVKRRLGHGAYGDVKLAELDGDATKPVAVKQFRQLPQGTEEGRLAFSLARELRVWADLKHDNVLSLTGFWLAEDRNNAWLVSPYHAHGNITQYIEKNKLDVRARLQLAIDTAKGLEYLHTRDIPVVHGDVKSANILVSKKPEAVLCDFGLARAMATPSGLTTAKNSGGTLRFMSPELFDEEYPEFSLSSDVWAWACVLHEILTDKTPYHDAKADAHIIARIAHAKEMPAPRDTLAHLGDIQALLERCWSIEPKLRPTMTECLDSLLAISRRVQFFGSELDSPTVVTAMQELKTEVIVLLEQKASLGSSINEREETIRKLEAETRSLQTALLEQKEHIHNAQNDFENQMRLMRAQVLGPAPASPWPPPSFSSHPLASSSRTSDREARGPYSGVDVAGQSPFLQATPSGPGHLAAPWGQVERPDAMRQRRVSTTPEPGSLRGLYRGAIDFGSGNEDYTTQSTTQHSFTPHMSTPSGYFSASPYNLSGDSQQFSGDFRRRRRSPFADELPAGNAPSLRDPPNSNNLPLAGSQSSQSQGGDGTQYLASNQATDGGFLMPGQTGPQPPDGVYARPIPYSQFAWIPPGVIYPSNTASPLPQHQEEGINPSPYGQRLPAPTARSRRVSERDDNTR